MSTLLANPKYNGPHACPKCGTKAHWTCVKESPIIVRVECEGCCGQFEKSFSEIQALPFFDKPIQYPARVVS